MSCIVGAQVETLGLLLLISIPQQSDAFTQTPDGRVTGGASVGGVAVWNNRICEFRSSRRRSFHIGRMLRSLRGRAIGDQAPPVLASMLCPVVGG